MTFLSQLAVCDSCNRHIFSLSLPFIRIYCLTIVYPAAGLLGHASRDDLRFYDNYYARSHLASR